MLIVNSCNLKNSAGSYPGIILILYFRTFYLTLKIGIGVYG